MYPLNLLSTGMSIFPLFSDQISGEPCIFDFSSKNPESLLYDTQNFARFQERVFAELAESGKTWGIGTYLEERKSLLRNYPQMIEEERWFHAGLDIIVKEDAILYAPIDAVVDSAGMEEGLGNYGGYVILQHRISSTSFSSFYGHLKREHMVRVGDVLKAGQPFARVGAGEESGGWFTHTHLQIITERARQEGRLMQGYVKVEDMQNINELFPTPYPLFRY